VGKTVLARQVIEDLEFPSHYASADEPTLRDRTWLEQQWDLARLQTDSNGGGKDALLVLDEVQKIADWSEVVKRLWDEDTAVKRRLKVILLGSAPLLIQKGLTESLAGRFESVPATHWFFSEMREAFGWNLETY
jgi:predicted AAA+ superfamily ATPase